MFFIRIILLDLVNDFTVCSIFSMKGLDTQARIFPHDRQNCFSLENYCTVFVKSPTQNCLFHPFEQQIFACIKRQAYSKAPLGQRRLNRENKLSLCYKLNMDIFLK